MSVTVGETRPDRLNVRSWVGGFELEIDVRVPEGTPEELFEVDIVVNQHIPGGGLRRLVAKHVRDEEREIRNWGRDAA